MTALLAGWPDRLRVLGRPWEVAVFGALPGLAIGYAAYWVATAQVVERDFVIFRGAGHDVIGGRSPYPPVDPAVLAHFDKFVYPPFSAILFVPAAELPLALGQALMFAVGIASVAVALRMLGVSDWRCYGPTLASTPVMNSLLLGSVTPLLLLGTASAWRYRRTAGKSGGAVAVAAVAKVFLWPLALWLLATRRIRAALAFAICSTILAVGGWAAIGFAGFRSYPQLLRVLSHVEEARGYGIIALLRLANGAAEIATAAVVVIVLLGIAAAARGEDADRRTFVLAVIGTVLATPLLWLHYFVFLFVPIALYRPRLSAMWFLPLAFWITPTTQPQGSLWRICIALSIVAAVTAGTIGERYMAQLVVAIRRRPARAADIATAASSQF